MAGFKPFGMPYGIRDSVALQLDEYESFKLVNYDNLSQDEAAVIMGVSRPTFTRIYNIALKKIAIAFTEGLAIDIGGGSVEFEKEWYKCIRCFKLIEGLDQHTKCENCPSFGNKELIRINQSSNNTKKK